jgi:hypothetical protein
MKDEDRKKIYEEEKIRLEAQKKIKKDLKRKEAEKNGRRLLIFLGFIGLIFILSFLPTVFEFAKFLITDTLNPTNSSSSASIENNKQESSEKVIAYEAGYNFGYYGQRSMAGLEVPPEKNKPVPEKYRGPEFEEEVKKGIYDGVRKAREELGMPLE